MVINGNIIRNMSFRHVRAFVSVAQHRSFSRAAKELAVSQPALTLTIRQFEDMVGVELLARTTRSVTPTACGLEFLVVAEKFLHDFEQSVLQIRARSLQQDNQVNIAVLPSVAIRLLPAAIQEFGKRNPDIRIRLHDDNGRGVQAQVLSGQSDFGISNQWEPHPDLEYMPLLQDRVGLVCHQHHPLAQGTGPVAWAALSAYQFVAMAGDTGISRLTPEQQGLPESVSQPWNRVLTIAALVGLIESGEAVSALPALASPEYLNPSLVFRPLDQPAIYRELMVIRLRERSLSAAAVDFMAFIQDQIPLLCELHDPQRVSAIIR